MSRIVGVYFLSKQNFTYLNDIDEILAVNMPNKVIFMELENMLRYCRLENKEKIWVVVYQKLEKEDFEGCQQIRNRIMNDMMEARCSAVTR